MKLLVVFLFLGISLTGHAQVLRGRVQHGQTGMPVSGAEITWNKDQQSTLADSLGQFSLALPQGQYHLHFYKKGFEAEHVDILLRRDTSILVLLFETRIELNEVVVEERLTHTANRAASIEIETMDADRIKKTAANNFSEAISSLPGVNSVSTGVGIAKPMIRGFTATRVQVIDNGVKQEGQQWGMDHGLEVDPFRVQRVEIIKGPATIQYGSDAISGIVNILPEAVPPPGLSGDFSTFFRSNNKARGASAALRYRKGAWYSGGRFTLQRYNDYHVPATQFTYNGYVLPIVDNRLLNTGGKDWSAQFLVGRRTARANWYVQGTHYNQLAGLFPGAMGIPRYNDLSNPEPDGELNLPMQLVQHTRGNVHVNKQLTSGWLEVDAGYQRNFRQELSPSHSHGYVQLDPSDSLALQLLLQTLSIRASYHTHLGEIDFTTGLNGHYQSNKIDGFEYLIPEYKSSQLGAFVLLGKDFGTRLKLNAGLRMDGAALRSKAFYQPWYKDLDSLVLRTPQIERNFLNYALALGANYALNRTWVAKFNYGKTFRVPAIAELGANGVHHGTFRHEVGNPELDPETGHQFDAGINGSYSKWLVKANVFFNYFSNIIYLSPSGQFSPLPEAGQLYLYQQDRALHTGFEVYLEYHPIDALHLEATSEYVYTYNLNTGLSLPFTPPFMQRFSATFEHGERWPLHLGAEWFLAADQNFTDRNEPTTPGYTIFHAFASIGSKFGHAEWELRFTLRNILNTAYLNNLSRYRILNLPEQGRNAILQLNINF